MGASFCCEGVLLSWQGSFVIRIGKEVSCAAPLSFLDGMERAK